MRYIYPDRSSASDNLIFKYWYLQFHVQYCFDFHPPIVITTGYTFVPVHGSAATGCIFITHCHQ